ncbi:MAG: iron ABC transporter permease [Gammaproteobacteria bacterium]|nr:iron ABC transporter permease [Gammaproteobacteria bacterium]
MLSRRLRPTALFGLLLFTALFVIPVAWFLLGAFWSRTAAAVTYQAVRNSVLIGIAVSLLSVGPGLALGWLSERRNFPLRRLITPLIWMLFLFPSYLLTTGWQIVMDTSWLRHSVIAHYFNGVAGIVFLLTMKGLPFAYFTGLAVWRMLGDNLFDALAALAVPKLRALRMVTGLLLPAAAAAGVVVFIETIQEFGIPATLGASIHLPIVTYAIYTQLTSAPPDFRSAALLSLPLVGLAVLAATAQAWMHHRHGVALLQARGSHTSAHHVLSRAASGGARFSVGTLAVIGVLVPLAGITYAAIGGAAGTSGDIADWSSLLNSLVYAMLGAGLSLLAVSAIWPALRARGTWYGQAVDALTLINMAIPGVVLGAAYLIVFNGTWLPLYGTPLLLVLAYGAAQVPMLLRLLQAPLSQVPRALHEAAVVHVVRHDTRLLDVRLPLVLGPLCWGYALAFGAIFFELPISELLYPPGRPPFGVAIVTFNQALDYTQAARLGLVAMVMLFLLGAVAATLMRLSGTFNRKYNDVPVAI